MVGGGGKEPKFNKKTSLVYFVKKARDPASVHEESS